MILTQPPPSTGGLQAPGLAPLDPDPLFRCRSQHLTISPQSQGFRAQPSSLRLRSLASSPPSDIEVQILAVCSYTWKVFQDPVFFSQNQGGSENFIPQIQEFRPTPPCSDQGVQGGTSSLRSKSLETPAPPCSDPGVYRVPFFSDPEL